MKVLIIGGGNMGKAFAKAIRKKDITTFSGEDIDLMILEKDVDDRIDILKEMNIGEVHTNPSCISSADIIIFAVKPQDATKLFEEVTEYVKPDQVLISIMAGLTIETISKYFQTDRIVRAMPNLPVRVEEGMTAFIKSKSISRIEIIPVIELLESTGKIIELKEEELMDVATGISGSGPAYVFFLMKSLIESACSLGFTKEYAELLITQTFYGSLQLYKNSDINCDEWIQQVSSKGGTTEVAMKFYNDKNLSDIILHGARQAVIKASDMGKKYT